MVVSKREAARRLLSTIGLTELRWRWLGPGLYCFNYHRIGDPSSCDFDRGVFSCTADRFREHVALIRERFEVLDLDRLLARWDRPPTRRPWALITFDDGYRDNYELAFPILREAGLTAVFFIPTAFIGGSTLPWWDEVAWTLRHATADRLALAGVPGEIGLEAADIDRTILRVLERVKARKVPLDEQVAEIREACRPDGSVRDAGLGLFIDRDGLREMRRAGMDIGSHTHSHRLLSHLDAPSQRAELEQSGAILGDVLGEPVPSIAYPDGTPASYTAETCRIAESLGYRVGFSFVRKANRLPIERPFEVSRFAVDDDRRPSDLKASVCFDWL